MQFYPDVEDKNILDFIRFYEPYLGYWKKSEEFLLSFAENIIRKNRPPSLLDLGCGEGRLLSKFAKYFKTVIALDPDEKRIDKAKTLAQNENINNVEFVNKSFLDAKFPDNKFDVIICSHIIQHIDTSDVEKFFKKIYSILKKSGFLVITTNHSRERSDFFVKNMNKDGEIVEIEILEEEFNNAIVNKMNILPIHFFSINNLKRYLSDFKIMKIKVFHSLYPLNILDKIIFRDKLTNLFFVKRFFGRDIMIIASKR